MSEYVCSDCIGEQFLKDKIDNLNNLHQCLICHKANNSLPIDELAKLIRNVLETNFQLTSNEPDAWEYALIKDPELNYEWYQDGYPIKETIIDILCIDDNGLAEEIIEHLGQYSPSYEDVLCGEIDPYEYESHYIEKDVDDYEHDELWNEFKNSVQSKARFLTPQTISTLQELFGDINSLCNHQKESVILKLESNGNNSIFRARTIGDLKDLGLIYSNPNKELGPPPSKYASSGRMNAKGISVFYGASCIKTCISEIRAPVGSLVVVGQFHVQKALNLLDLDKLANVFSRGSFFDPNSQKKWSRMSVLRKLSKQFIQPVLPTDVETDYLTTQVFSEFIANFLDEPIDGVIHTSSQYPTGKNIVLFNHVLKNDINELSEENDSIIKVDSDSITKYRVKSYEPNVDEIDEYDY